MNLEKFFELVLNNPDNISIKYSNINGKESLTVNGEDLSEDFKKKEEFDDTEIKKYIADYKKNIDNLDDDIFVEAMEDAGEVVNLSTIDALLSQESYTEKDAYYVKEYIAFINNSVKDTINSRINYLEDLSTRF